MTRLAKYLALHCELQICTDIIIYTETRILRHSMGFVGIETYMNKIANKK